MRRVPALTIPKHREHSFRALPGWGGAATAYAFEAIQALRTYRVLLPRIVDFARTHKVEALWVVLQGQTMLRLARPLSRKLGLPLFTQIWDPFAWWLRDNIIDLATSKRLIAEYDAVLRQSAACATPSWAMAEEYKRRHSLRPTPVIAGLSKGLARSPGTAPHVRESYIIGMAGQFYSQDEWNCLIHTLNLAEWRIAGRPVRIRVLGGSFKAFTQSPGDFEYLGWRSQEETIRLLAETDLLYLPYWFSEKFREEACYSFPSKLVTYFAAGRPVFFHGPDYASPAQYLKEHRAAHLCHSMDPPAVLNGLKSLLCDQAAYAAFARNGSACFARDFTLERMRETFFDFLRPSQ